VRKSTGLFAALILSLSTAAAAGAGNKRPPDPNRAWAPWKRMPFDLGYPMVLRTNEKEIQFWFSATNRGMDRIFGFVAPSLGAMRYSDRALRFGADIIRRYDRPLNGIKHPLITRSSCTVLKNGTHIVLAAIGPRYQGGSELYPALFVSPDGKAGTWKHLGPPAGDPEEWLKKARRINGRFRIEGGSIVELEDGTLRMYIYGFTDMKDLTTRKQPPPRKKKGKKGRSGRGVSLYNHNIFIAEAPKPEGPWKFRKNMRGRCIGITEGLSPDCQWLFPNVMQIGKHGYMLTGVDKWVPTSTWAAFSLDGVKFHLRKDDKGKVTGPIFVPSMVAPGMDSIKGLRGAFNPANSMFEAVAIVSPVKNPNWHVYHSRIRFPLEVFQNLAK
jgi:hypothetical protein